MNQQVRSTTLPTNYGALGTLVSVFFFWGFIAASNSVFIPYCKHKFELDQFQSQLIDFAFYGAYYIGALLLYLISVNRGKISWLGGALRWALSMDFCLPCWVLWR